MSWHARATNSSGRVLRCSRRCGPSGRDRAARRHGRTHPARGADGREATERGRTRSRATGCGVLSRQVERLGCNPGSRPRTALRRREGSAQRRHRRRRAWHDQDGEPTCNVTGRRCGGASALTQRRRLGPGQLRLAWDPGPGDRPFGVCPWSPARERTCHGDLSTHRVHHTRSVRLRSDAGRPVDWLARCGGCGSCFGRPSGCTKRDATSVDPSGVGAWSRGFPNGRRAAAAVMRYGYRRVGFFEGCSAVWKARCQATVSAQDGLRTGRGACRGRPCGNTANLGRLDCNMSGTGTSASRRGGEKPRGRKRLETCGGVQQVILRSHTPPAR